ncbi:MMPL family transporter [Streptomyces sp. NPDC058572]|uniref:MMPL family transporter n=1 Tax=Streptomyces sp. NPDC058572 TaxID=3346546 RepID=UPI00364E1BDD
MIDRLAGFSIRAPKVVLALAGLAFVLCGVLGSKVSDRLLAGGFLDPGAESSRAANVMADEFGLSGAQFILAVESAQGTTDARTTARAKAIVAGLRQDERVETVASPWTPPQGGAHLISRDGHVGLVVATLKGDDNAAQKTAKDLSDRYTGEADGATVTAGGQAMAFSEIGTISARDLAVAESIAIVLTFLLLVRFLRSWVAAAIPLVVGITAIVGTTAVLYLLTLVTDLSVFAMNIATGLGLALAIDYSLLVIGRFREEIAEGRGQHEAIAVALRRGGRAVVYSGLVVGIALIGMTFFPIYFLKSIGYAGVAVVALSIVLALTVVPALLSLFGTRINRKPLREAGTVESSWLYRVAVAVQRRPVVFALPVLALLLVSVAPVLGLRLGLPDDRVLPVSAQSHQVGDKIRNGFDENVAGAVRIVVEDMDDPDELESYAEALSRVESVKSVVAPAGSYSGGQRVGPGEPAAMKARVAYLTVQTPLNPYSSEAARQLDALRTVPAPGHILLDGLGPQTRDTAESIARGIPKALAWIAATTFVLLLLLTGSVVMPLKALVLNTLSLTASFGAMVWIFQDGHLGALGTTSTGYTVATVPVLLFCIAFGLSMDYEVFLLARFSEEWEKSGRTRADNDTAVAVGLARSGRVVTAAAVMMAVVFAGIATSGVSLMRMLGLGLTLAVLVDATLVRVVLVPAFMRVAGTWNWWSPRPARSGLERVRLRE